MIKNSLGLSNKGLSNALGWFLGAAALMAGEKGLILPGKPPVGGVVTPVEAWYPKWKVGDVLGNTNLPNWTFTVTGISYNPWGYNGRMSFAGAVHAESYYTIQNMEESDVYLINGG